MESPDVRAARQWFTLAVSVLVLAGLLAVALVGARMPPFDQWITDPAFFKRCLVVHVNLSLVVWFQAFAAALMFLLPSGRSPGPLGARAVWISATGVGLMIAASPLPSAEPILSNYIPMLDHPLYAMGLALVVFGVLASLLDRRADEGPPSSSAIPVDEAAQMALNTAGGALVLAAAVAAISWTTLTPGLPPTAMYENLFWGAGHVLQLASEAAMVAVWLLLVAGVTGRSPLSGNLARWLFTALIVPWLAAVPLAAAGTSTGIYRAGFTFLMRWSIFPVVTLIMALCLTTLWRWWGEHDRQLKALADPRVLGFAVSAGLTALGFLLGAMIRGSNTIVPAHYHASIGGVTAAFMAFTYVWLPTLGLALPGGAHRRAWRRAARWQPAMFGLGQMVFAVGFAFAGAHGMMRKAYGHEQAGRGVQETLGLVIMGSGGMLAVLGGLLFLFIVSVAWATRWRRFSRPKVSPTVPGGSDEFTEFEDQRQGASPPTADGQPLVAASARARGPHPVLHPVGMVGDLDHRTRAVAVNARRTT